MSAFWTSVALDRLAGHRPSSARALIAGAVIGAAAAAITSSVLRR
jgi:hypothetical protein